LLECGRRHEARAEATFVRALALRDAIDTVFRDATRGRLASASDLAIVQDEYVIALRHAFLVSSGDRFEWQWSDDAPELDRLLWPVANSAVELLTTGDLARIKACPEGCTWLFYDLSKNGSRRWCSMEGCGSHAKMRRYRARQRSRGDTTRPSEGD
jgi:predicted RNA-binding Zn ribbon-like protein